MSAEREAKAWRWVARRIASVELDPHNRFLCLEADEARYREGISDVTHEAMRGRVHAHKAVAGMEEVGAWTDSASAYEAKCIRVLAALFLAIECEDEAESRSVAGDPR